MSLEQQIETSKDTIQNLLANLAFFQSRNDTGLIRETAQDIREQQFLISKLQTDINRRDSPLGQLDIINSEISQLRTNIIKKINEEKIIRASANEAFSKARRLDPRFEARFNRQGRAEILRADEIIKEIETLQTRLNEKIKQRENLQNTLDSFSFDNVANNLQETQTQEQPQNNLRNLLLIGGALAIL